MIQLHTLGDTLITVGEKKVRPSSPQLFAALLYLGLERGRRVPRTALQEMLFPDADERSGAHSLRQLLYKLRQLGAPLDGDSRSVSLPADRVLVDFEGESANGGAPDSTVEKAGRGFLPGYEPEVNGEFASWLEAQRNAAAASLRRQIVSAMSAFRESLQWSGVERCARTLLRIDPLNEEATLALAEATALSGAKAKALAILADYEAETGNKELHVASSLLRRRISENVVEHSRRALSTPFVGRDAEVLAVRQQVLRARSGTPSMVVLAGEPGIGKTRLLEECAALAALEGMRVQVVRCQPHYVSRPMGVFIELVPQLLTCRGALGIAPHALAHLKYLTSHSDDATDRPVDARDDATRAGVLLAALRDLVDAVSSETPLLIAVEDVHWSDQDSVRELCGLIHKGSKRQLLVIFTTRFDGALNATVRLPEDAVVRRLKPLGDPQMETLAQHLLPRRPADAQLGDVTSWCITTAAGNPLFLQMLCAHYAETGTPFRVPPDLISAITRRLELLPRDCRRVLEFAAVLGRHSTMDSLRTLSECSQLQLLNAIQRLEDEGYIRESGANVAVSHALLSDCILGALSPLTRAVLHGCVAEYLQKRYETGHDAAMMWDCAEQLDLSAQLGKALRFLLRCASHSLQIGRATEALSVLARAKRFARSPQEYADVVGEMMMAARAAGQLRAAYEYAIEYSALPAEAREPAQNPGRELKAIEIGWHSAFDPGRNVAHILAIAKLPTLQPIDRFNAAGLVLRIAHVQADEQLARSALDSVEPILRRHDTYEARYLPLLYHSVFGDIDLAFKLIQEIENDLVTFESISTRCRAANLVVVTLIFLGEYARAYKLSGEYFEWTGATGLSGWQREFCTHACTSCVITEDVENAVYWHDLAESFGPGIGALAYQHVTNGVEIAILQGNEQLARRRLAATPTVTQVPLHLAAYLRGAEMRINLLNPSYVCDAKQLDELLALFEQTKRATCADCLAVAIAENLRRSGRQADAISLLTDYVASSRRERSPIPPLLTNVLDACSER